MAGQKNKRRGGVVARDRVEIIVRLDRPLAEWLQERALTAGVSRNQLIESWLKIPFEAGPRFDKFPPDLRPDHAAEAFASFVLADLIRLKLGSPALERAWDELLFEERRREDHLRKGRAK